MVVTDPGRGPKLGVARMLPKDRIMILFAPFTHPSEGVYNKIAINALSLGTQLLTPGSRICKFLPLRIYRYLCMTLALGME